MGSVERNCRRYNGFFQPLTPMYCAGLYQWEPVSGTILQLTGLNGSSVFHNFAPVVSDDGATVEYSVTSLVPESRASSARLDVATGAVEAIPTVYCCSWNRGDSTVTWDPSYQRLLSTDVATGAVTDLLTLDGAELISSATNGRYLVLRDQFGAHQLIDTDDGDLRAIPGSWVDDDAEDNAIVQSNVAPSGENRLILAPLR